METQPPTQPVQTPSQPDNSPSPTPPPVVQTPASPPSTSNKPLLIIVAISALIAIALFVYFMMLGQKSTSTPAETMPLPTQEIIIPTQAPANEEEEVSQIEVEPIETDSDIQGIQTDLNQL